MRVPPVSTLRPGKALPLLTPDRSPPDHTIVLTCHPERSALGAPRKWGKRSEGSAFVFRRPYLRVPPVSTLRPGNVLPQPTAYRSPSWFALIAVSTLRPAIPAHAAPIIALTFVRIDLRENGLAPGKASLPCPASATSRLSSSP